MLAKDNARWMDAERYYREVLVIARELARKDPDFDQTNLAGVLNNLGNLLVNNRMHQTEAEDLYREALVIARKLAKKDVDSYHPLLAEILKDWGAAYLKWRQPVQAEFYLKKAVEVLISLTEKVPERFLVDLKDSRRLLQEAIDAQQTGKKRAA